MSFIHKGALFFLILFAIILPQGAFAVTPAPPSQPAAYVVDLAGVVGADTEARLNARLKELEEKTGAQVVILTIQSLDGQDITAFSLNTAEKWKLGQKGKDNGVLITVAVNDRKYRFEIGYGLERVLPDSFVGTLGREYFIPSFRKGDYAAGIYGAADDIAGRIAADAGVTLSAPDRTVSSRAFRSGPSGWFADFISRYFIQIFFVFFIVIQIVIRMLGRSGRRYSRGGGVWMGGGGFGGGGGGGFSGGGGSFGGGGAGGGW